MGQSASGKMHTSPSCSTCSCGHPAVEKGCLGTPCRKWPQRQAADTPSSRNMTDPFNFAVGIDATTALNQSLLPTTSWMTDGMCVKSTQNAHKLSVVCGVELLPAILDEDRLAQLPATEAFRLQPRSISLVELSV